MLGRIIIFLVDNIAAFFVILLLLRFHFQWLRVGFRNPVGEFIIAATNWVVRPARRVIPGLAAAWLLQAVALWTITAVAGSELGVAPIAALAFVQLLRYSIYILMFAVFIQVVLSWVNPHTPVAPVLEAVTGPFLRPLRRYVPPVGRVDLSPFVLFLLLGVLLFPLEELARASAHL
jgi:YggT family protein